MELNKYILKEAGDEDFDAVMEVEKQAFASNDEAKLVADLLKDKTAEPILSLLAFNESKAIGHILFTRVYIENQPDVLAHILAPLAVVPAFQKQGIGGLLIKRGLEILKDKGSVLVFVLGHIAYYPKHGFINDAGDRSFEAPYEIPKEHADAWMVQELESGAIDKYKGKITCADMLMKPEYWRE